MSKYQISNRNSGHILGTYTGETLEEALTAAAQDAGYRDHAHACEATGSCTDLIAGEVDEEDDDYPFDAVTRVVAMQCQTCGRPMSPGPSTSDYPDCNTWACRQCGRTEPEMLSARLATAAVDAVPYPEITDDQIRALQRNAAAAGDLEMVQVCQAALDGSESHRAECLRVLEATQAVED